jgi:hypothetical protein
MVGSGAGSGLGINIFESATPLGALAKITKNLMLSPVPTNLDGGHMIEQAVLLLLKASELILGAASVSLLLAAEVGAGARQVAAAVQLQPAPGHAPRLHQAHVLVSSLYSANLNHF